MAVSWNIIVKNEVTGERFDDGVTADLKGEVRSLAGQFKLGALVRTRRPEKGEVVHEYEHGTIVVHRNNLQTVRKRRTTGWV